MMKKTDYYTDEKTLSEFGNALRLYKQKNNLDFVLNSQLMIKCAFVYAIDYIDENLSLKVKKIHLVNTYPVIEHDNGLLLVLPFINGHLMRGINKGNIGIDVPLDNILYDYYQLKDGKKLNSQIMVLNYFTKNESGQLKEATTVFGRMFLKEPTIISVEELVKSKE